MESTPTPAELSAAAGISLSYAHMILNEKRTPSLTTAIHIFRKTGHKFGPIANASDDQIEVMAQVYGVAA